MFKYNPWPLVDAVRAVEVEQHLSVRRAAKRAGLSATTYFEASRGRKTPSLKTAVQLCRFAGLEFDRLIGY